MISARFALCMISLATLSTTLAGCTPVVAGAGIFAANRVLTAEGTNMAAQNYAVADYLIQQADTFIGRKSIITAQPLTDIQTPEMSTTLAQLIPEQIGVRLSQLGYRMDLSEVTTSIDTSYVKPEMSVGQTPDFILTGNYLRKGSELDVKTRIIDLNRNRIVASFDYILAADNEIRRLSEPKPKIMRMPSAQ